MTFIMDKPVKEAIKTFIPEINLQVKSLPSRALAYPVNTTIHYRPYLFGEIKKVSQSQMSIRDQIHFVLSGVECGFDPLDLTFADALYIGFLRKISTLGTTEVLVKYYCDICDKDCESIVKTDDMNFDEIKAEKLPIIATIAGKEMHFNPLRTRSFFDLFDQNLTSDVGAGLASCVINMPFDAAYSLIEAAPPQDFEILNEIDRLLNHSLAPVEVHHKSKSEETHTNLIELDGGQALILPFRSDTKSFQDRIRFGS